jgi:putative ABC transport system permease protein
MRIYLNWVDYDFVDVYQMKLIEGRNFSREFSTDADGAFLLNEAAVKALGWDSALGKTFGYGSPSRTRTGKIIGVVKDFHMRPFHNPISPLCFYLDFNNADTFLSVKVKGGRLADTLSSLEGAIKKFSPNYPFIYHFFDEIFNMDYQLEQKIGNIFSIFALLATIIACLGLFGLSSFTIEQRTKEIGIRKVFGASVPGIAVLLSKEFTRWVITANIIAWPIAYWAMNHLLRIYAYRIDIGIFTFIFSALAALVIAALAVSYQALKAARANPVESLRYE